MKITFYSFYKISVSKLLTSTGGTNYGNHLYHPVNVFCQNLLREGHLIVEPTEKFDVAIFLDVDKSLFEFAKTLDPAIKKILITVESPIYCPFEYNLNVLFDEVWDKVLTYNRSFGSDSLIYYDIPVTGNIEGNDFIYPDKTAKGVAVSSFKNDSRGYVPLRRDKLLKTLAQMDQIHLYGNGWELGKNIYGKTSNKLDSMKGHAFAVVVENCKYDGYVTEKLGDAILSGLPCMYYGDYKNAERRFPGTFVVLDDLTYEAFEKAKNEILNNYECMVDNVKKSFDESELWIDSFITNANLAIKA